MPRATRLINGPLFSVNPIALCQNIQILATNKRCLNELQTEAFGKVLLLEIGATASAAFARRMSLASLFPRAAKKAIFVSEALQRSRFLNRAEFVLITI